MIINHKNKYIFCSVPKTGCTTIMSQLNRDSLGQKPNIYHAPLYYGENIDTKYNDYYKFGFVRNPLDRFVSIFLEGISDLGHINEWSKDLLKYKNIKDFIVNFKNSGFQESIHFRPQYKFYYLNSKNYADKIYRYEDYNNACKEISKKINININTNIHLRKVDKGTKTFMDFYDTKTLKIITDFYSKDFSYFNYELPTT